MLRASHQALVLRWSSNSKSQDAYLAPRSGFPPMRLLISTQLFIPLWTWAGNRYASCFQTKLKWKYIIILSASLSSRTVFTMRTHAKNARDDFVRRAVFYSVLGYTGRDWMHRHWCEMFQTAWSMSWKKETKTPVARIRRHVYFWPKVWSKFSTPTAPLCPNLKLLLQPSSRSSLEKRRIIRACGMGGQLLHSYHVLPTC